MSVLIPPEGGRSDLDAYQEMLEFAPGFARPLTPVSLVPWSRTEARQKAIDEIGFAVTGDGAYVG